MNKEMTWGAYETPTVKELDILSEGVLCASGFDYPGNGYDPDNDLGEI